MGKRNSVGMILRMAVLCPGLLLAGLTLALLAGSTPIQAAAGMAQLTAPLGSGAVDTHTVYLPIVRGVPAPEEQLIDLIDAERLRRGVNALQVNSVLMQVAEAHSQDMINRNFFDHTNPDGQDPGDRLDEAGYAWSA